MPHIEDFDLFSHDLLQIKVKVACSVSAAACMCGVRRARVIGECDWWGCGQHEIESDAYFPKLVRASCTCGCRTAICIVWGMARAAGASRARDSTRQPAVAGEQPTRPCVCLSGSVRVCCLQPALQSGRPDIPALFDQAGAEYPDLPRCWLAGWQLTLLAC